MKKRFKFVLVVALAVVSVSANAQLGVQFGWANSTERAKSGNVKLKGDAMNGFKIGVNYDFGLPVEGLSIRPGLNYMYLGDKLAEQQITGITVKFNRNDHYLNIPVDVKYAYAFSDDFKVFAFAGPKFAIGLASSLTANYSGSILGQDYNGKATISRYSGKVTVKDGDAEIGENIFDDSGRYNRFDLQLGLGAGVQYKSLSLEFGYDWGLLNLAKNAAGDYRYKRNQLYLSLGYNF